MFESRGSRDIYWQEGEVTRLDREMLRGHRGATLWLTGLSASGKSTLAHALEASLFGRRCEVCVLDGDNVRHGLNRDLGFGPEDRKENIRRVGEVAKLFTDYGALVLTAFISPYRADRESIRTLMNAGDFIEVYVDCPLPVCETRDPKGLYHRARCGELRDFTGVSAPYEPPLSPELYLRTDLHSVEECVGKVITFLEVKGYLPAAAAAAPAAD